MTLDEHSHPKPPSPAKPRSRGRPSKADDAATARKRRKREWQARYRKRQSSGARVCEVSGATIELLIVTNWLSADQAGDAAAIARALDAMASDALRARR